MYKIVITTLFILFLTLTSFSQNNGKKEITVDKIWTEDLFRPETIEQAKSMNDGIRYTLIENAIEINIYEYETDDFVETIFTTDNLLIDENDDPVNIDNYHFNDDESMILIATETEAIYRRSRESVYYIWDIEKESLALLAEGDKQRLATFSPCGNKIAFVRNNNIYVRDIETKDIKPITDDGVYNEIINGTTDWVYEEEFAFTQGFFWSPDSEKIAYYKFDESHVKEFVMMLYNEQLYPEEYRFKYPKAGEENAFVTIHIYDFDTGESIMVDTGEEKDQYIPRVKWTTDPDKLSIQRMNRHQNQLEILLADASDGNTELLYKEDNIYYIDITDDLTFLDDNKHFIITSEKDGFNHIYLYNMEGRRVRQITKGEWDVTSFLGVDQEKELIYYTSREESPFTNNLYSIGLDGKTKTRLTSDDGFNTPSFSKGHKFFINRHSTLNKPPKYTIHKSSGEIVKVRQDNEKLDSITKEFGYVPVEYFSFKTSEDVELNGWKMKPADFDPEKEYPVFMYVYGGPGSQTVLDRWNAYNGAWFQMLVQNGYIVVSVDNRGTGGRGEEFKKMTYLQLGKYETIDQIEAAKHLASLEYVDPSRIGIFGWSYGGYLSSLCLAKGKDVFSMAIAVAPVTTWRFYDTIYTERYMRTPQENPDGYDDNSPINHVDSIIGDYLLVHGTADDNVHYQNAVEMANALIKTDVDFEMMIYPDHNHSIRGDNARRHLYRLMTDFILRTL